MTNRVYHDASSASFVCGTFKEKAKNKSAEWKCVRNIEALVFRLDWGLRNKKKRSSILEFLGTWIPLWRGLRHYDGNTAVPLRDHVVMLIRATMLTSLARGVGSWCCLFFPPSLPAFFTLVLREMVRFLCFIPHPRLWKSIPSQF